MTTKMQSGMLLRIPIDRIDVLNPRERDNIVFSEVVENIKTIGLKKPITVTPRKDVDGNERYLLICGEGRLKAFKALGQDFIPALVVEVSDDDAFIMSLAENIARLKRRPLEGLMAIEQLSLKGYGPKDIAEKTGLAVSYITGLLSLLEKGEERLIESVEKGRIPLYAALRIVEAGNEDKAVQAALQEAFESGRIQGRELTQMRKVVALRKNYGRTIKIGSGTSSKPAVTSSSLVHTFRKEVERQKLMVKKHEFVQQHLLFAVSALRELFCDENFGNLLKAEGLNTLPKYLADQIWKEAALG